MHAMVATVTIADYESAQQQLHERVIPMVKQAPGFVGGYWLAPADGEGLGLVVFDTEENANAMATRLRGPDVRPEGVEVVSIDVREVAGSA
jgi:hypothetical protein